MNVFDFRSRRALDTHASEVVFEHARAAGLLPPDDGAFEAKLRQAMRVQVPETLLERVLLAQTTAQATRLRFRVNPLWALAASLFLVALGGLFIGRAPPAGSTNLVDLSVEHISTYEVDAPWSKGRIPPGSVRAVFAEFGLALTDQMAPVSYINRCPLGEFRTIHMVLSTADGPVSALYVANAAAAERVTFKRGDYSGSVLQFGHGALVLLAKGEQDLTPLETTLKRAINASAVAYQPSLTSDAFAR